MKARNISGSSISSKTFLVVMLRWLVGAWHLDLCFAQGLASSTFYSDRGVIWTTIEAIDEAFELGLPTNNA